MNKIFTLFLSTLLCCFFSFSLFGQGGACFDAASCDTSDPLFTLEVVPSVGMSGTNVISARLDITLRNNSAAPLEMNNIDVSMGFNTAALPSFVSVTSDGAQFPNVGSPFPPDCLTILDDLITETNSYNGQSYDLYYEYTHAIGFPPFCTTPAQVIAPMDKALIMSTFITFDGTQAFTAADLCNPGFLTVFPGRCFTMDSNINNRFGFITPALSDCYSVECIPPSTQLPLELTVFSGEVFDRHNELYWTTATETNTLMHHIERSPAPGNVPFETIGRVEAAGFSELPTDYNFEDENPLRVGYYRLRTESLEGNLEYSDVVFLKRNDAAGILATFPNPTADRFYVQVSLEGPSSMQFDIIDVLGRVMETSIYEEDEGLITLEFDLSPYATGLYFIRMSDGLETSIIPVIKNRP